MSRPSTAPPVPAGEVDPLAPELIGDPSDGYGRLRERAPVLRGRYVDGSATWFVTRQADVRTVLADPRFANDVSSVPGAVDSRANVTAMLGVPPEYTATSWARSSTATRPTTRGCAGSSRGPSPCAGSPRCARASR